MPKDNRRLTVRVFFREYQPCMALGVPNTEAVNCTFCGADAVPDLHRPSCAARVAGYVFGGFAGMMSAKQDSITAMTFCGRWAIKALNTRVCRKNK
ncbi:hypothetical protein [uncultured Ruminococcus sp.]|uniref:hypothetical protein n=1 Tax=uncultured Ruminococcus sp. TaxID=165186 RepID=UPI0025F6A9CA|nr:hypothetical protein [uncultured Ruminococcus sp.]